MNGVHLTGLQGTNPLGFLAALGIQVLFEHDKEQPRLWWSDDVIRYAVVDDAFDVDRIVQQAMEEFPRWAASPALNPPLPEDKAKRDKLKFDHEHLRQYLEKAQNGHPGNALATALVAEGSMDNNGMAKPSDLYFTAGQQKFLEMARQILEGTDENTLIKGISSQWDYKSSLPSLMWDVTDDRIYALAATDPAKDKKETNPGPEALAILGLSRYPVFASPKGTLTLGCYGTWKRGTFSWPIWTKPAGQGAVRSLLAHATYTSMPTWERRIPWLRSWGVSTVLRSAIRRSSQGGYGTFAPPEMAWSTPK